MDRISIMPSSLADLIAAGEVVERPASALKELVENAIDAKAQHIYVELTEGGLKSILVKDDGVGMSRHDAELCIKRHASSKIHTSYDLMSIRTMGFRGEALPSIAAVSTLRIDTSDGVEGTTVTVAGDKEPTIQDAPLRKGTTVRVSDLFYNTPARLKYMKSAESERARCLDVVEHLALGFAGVAFDVRTDGRQVFTTTGRGDPVEVIQRIWGADIARRIMRVEVDSDTDYSFVCLAAQPEVNYASRYQIMTFINSRYIYSYRLTKGIEEAYRDHLAPLRYPFCVVMITADPARVDVNVHPSKREVRISDEISLAASIKAAIRGELNREKPVYSDRDTTGLLDRRLDAEKSAETPFSPAPATPISPKRTSIDEMYGNELLAGVSGIAFQGNDAGEVERAISHNSASAAQPAAVAQVEKKPSIYDNLYPLGQVAKTYIICDSTEGMYIIDQHAAAERINFEKFEKLFENNIHQVAPIEPLIIEFPPSVVSSFDGENSELLKRLGLVVEPFSPTSLKLVAMPEFLTDKNYMGVIKDLIVAAAEGRKESPLDLMRKAVSTLACKASVRAGDELSPFAQVALIRHLSECVNPANCPHGRPTGVRISIPELEKLFKRSGF